MATISDGVRKADRPLSAQSFNLIPRVVRSAAQSHWSFWPWENDNGTFAIRSGCQRTQSMERRTVGAKRALKSQQVWAIRFWLDHEGRLRDRALFDLAIDSKLRGCDVVKVKIGDLVSGGCIRARAIVVQRKTKRPVQFELLEAAKASLLAWLVRRGGTVDDYAFPSRIYHTTHLSTRQYAGLVDEWVTAIGLRKEDYGTHSLRRTKASIIYRATGNLRAVQILLGHTKIESTVRYLGVDVEDALTLAEGTEV